VFDKALHEELDPALPTTWKELAELARNTIADEGDELGELEGRATGENVGVG
jgi:hypothetical protein